MAKRLLCSTCPPIALQNLLLSDDAHPLGLLVPGFVLVGLVLLLPVILGYTGWSYRVFAGKVAADSGYH